MNQQCTNNIKRRGAALSAMVLSTCVIGGSMVIAGIATTTHRWTQGVRHLGNEARATAIAEAGAMEAYLQLSADWRRVTHPELFVPSVFVETAYGGGTYLSTVTTNGPYVLVECLGRFHDAQATVSVVYSKIDPGQDGSQSSGPSGAFAIDDIPMIAGPGPASPFAYAVLVGGEVNWGGTAGGGAPGAWVHGNQQVTVYGNGLVGASVSSAEGIHTQGGACNITSNAVAPFITGQPNIRVDGTVTQKAVAPIPIPQINFEPYRDKADYYNQYFSKDVDPSFSGTKHIDEDLNLESVGGVLFVDGDLHLNGGTLKGCFVATGDIHVNAQVRHSRIDGLPALMTNAGSIRINGGAQIEGLLYARTGNLDKLNGNAVLRGSIIAGGFMETNGTFDFVFEDNTPNPPWSESGVIPGSNGQTGGGGDSGSKPIPARLLMAAWQD